MDFEVINVHGHYEAYQKGNGKFICSGDTKNECTREAKKCLTERQMEV